MNYLAILAMAPLPIIYLSLLFHGLWELYMTGFIVNPLEGAIVLLTITLIVLFLFHWGLENL